MTADDPSTWWTISVTSMNRDQATAAANLIRERFPHVYADPVDPKRMMTLHTDRWTTQLLRDGVAELAARGRESGSMLEFFDEWLAQAELE